MFGDGRKVLPQNDIGQFLTREKFLRINSHVSHPHSALLVWVRKNIRASRENKMKPIAVENPGKEYRLVVAGIPKPTPQDGEVLIKVSAAGLNHADMNQAEGRYPPPPGASQTLGMEVSGEIAELGAGVSDFKVGDKVWALIPGGR